tara:strand:- start:2825 stop:3193 length:369 start_codon:yes stop_codon:yes gene_type:complete
MTSKQKYIENGKIHVSMSCNVLTKDEARILRKEEGDYEFRLDIHNRDSQYPIPFLVGEKIVMPVYTPTDQRRDKELGPLFFFDFGKMKTKEDLVSLIEEFRGKRILEATRREKEFLDNYKLN